MSCFLLDFPFSTHSLTLSNSMDLVGGSKHLGESCSSHTRSWQCVETSLCDRIFNHRFWCGFSFLYDIAFSSSNLLSALQFPPRFNFIGDDDTCRKQDLNSNRHWYFHCNCRSCPLLMHKGPDGRGEKGKSCKTLRHQKICSELK